MTARAPQAAIPPHSEEPPQFACPSFAAAMDVISRRWNGLIVQAVGTGCSTFTAIGGYIGMIGDTMLAKRLRELEDDGLIAREVIGGRPVRVRYSLTPCGADLVPILERITQWGHAHALAEGPPRKGGAR